MKNPLILSLVQLTRPDGRTLVVAAVLWSLVGFIALWSGVTWLINYFDPFSSSWSSVLFGWLSSIISLVLTILFFPALMAMAIGLFQERAAGIVEAQHYPNLDPPRQSSIAEQVRLGGRFLVWTILVNGLAFPLYFLPFANVFILLFVNGFVIGSLSIMVLSSTIFTGLQAYLQRLKRPFGTGFLPSEIRAKFHKHV